MPEGHTLFRLAADQNKTIGKQILRITSPQGRFSDGAATIDGLRLNKVESLGKHLFYHFKGENRCPPFRPTCSNRTDIARSSWVIWQIPHAFQSAARATRRGAGSLSGQAIHR